MLRPLGFAAAGVALLGLLLNWPDAEPAHSAGHVVAPQSDEPRARAGSPLDERVAALEHQVEQLTAALAALAPAEADARRSVDVRTDAAEETPLHGVSALSDALLLEDTDERWEQDIADYLLARLNEPSWSRSGLLEIDCRTALCRAQLEHASDDEARAFLASLSFVELEVASSTFELDTSGGRSVSTLVLVRSGSALPRQR